jgi:hypothetical protein
MKFSKVIFGFVFMFLVACGDGYIDEISAVDPGPDMASPTVAISFPSNGTKIRVREDVAPVTIRFDVRDDIEVASIELILDGNKIGELSSFKDYRKVLDQFVYEDLTNGSHELTVRASDQAGKTAFQTVSFEKIEPYQPVYSGEIFYMPFDGEFLELVSIREAAKVGFPTFANEGVSGKSFAGAANSYITFPTSGLLGNAFSAAFWYKINAAPDRSGILVIGPPDPNNPNTPNNRNNGFRLFREGGATNQTFKLNVGNGSGDNWYDGGASATINPTTVNDWIHIAFTISNSNVVVYMNGNIVSQGSFSGVGWTGCDILSIGSGAPRFTEWGHLSDLSLYDELRLFNKALTQQEVQTIMNGD